MGGAAGYAYKLAYIQILLLLILTLTSISTPQHLAPHSFEFNRYLVYNFYRFTFISTRRSPNNNIWLRRNRGYHLCSC
ncbi:uncharacterized protein VTP21DRAFT_6261 [Calcarisporiella thermophila]|uniref:uncharacterized protein n=1 Tax=Calcarisporiella thermophila TaxID=911321 RepID=UPI0037437009